MIEMGLQSVVAAIQDAFHKKDRAKIDQLLWPALDQFPEYPPLWFFAANQHFETGASALAIQDFRRAIELEDNPIYWSNLGAALRRINRTDEARRCLLKALEKNPMDGSSLTNMCATYVNEGMPEEGIAWGEKALTSPQAGRAEWNLALLYLEAGNFKRGFELYHTGVNNERQMRMFTNKKDRDQEPQQLTPDSPREGKTLVVYGEQGLGDEIMFATVLPDALDQFEHIIFECHPRLEGLHRRTFDVAISSGKLTIHPTRKDAVIAWPKKLRKLPDYKGPLGDLSYLYRQDRADFNGGVFGQNIGHGFALFEEPRTTTQEYRRRLEALANGRKIVGFAVRGGVIQTNRQYRTIRGDELDPLFKRKDIMLVALDYEDITQQVQFVREKYGQDQYFWFPAITHAWDYGDHTAALVAACDFTVTVCQSVAHLSAGLGKPTLVLTPSRPAWRYGLKGEDWYWYQDPSVKLLRQQENPRGKFDWGPAIERLIECVDELVKETP